MRRTIDDSGEMPGQDSFLDVIANMVGIMILLVMVMGVRASYSVEPPASSQQATSDDTPPIGEEDVRIAARAAEKSESELMELVQRVRAMRGQAMLREEERNMLAGFVAEGNQELEERRNQLSQEQQRDFDLRQQLSDAQRQLEDLTRQQIALLSQEPGVEILENLPTPLARTVTGEEVHLRLGGGFVAIVPFDELQREFESQVERNVWRLREQGSMEGTAGPINGFRLRFRLRIAQVSVPGRGGMDRVHGVPEFRCEFIPVSTPVGEPLEQALLPTSELIRTLKRLPPPSTTVTIWTYPDSFGEFRRLKKLLFDMGFPAAGRPLPEGVSIAASNRGTKSAAQ